MILNTGRAMIIVVAVAASLFCGSASVQTVENHNSSRSNRTQIVAPKTLPDSLLGAILTRIDRSSIQGVDESKVRRILDTLGVRTISTIKVERLNSNFVSILLLRKPQEESDARAYLTRKGWDKPPVLTKQKSER